MSFDPSIWQTAFQRLPLPRLMTTLGDGAFTKKKSSCPFCDAKGGKWAVFEKNGRHLFKCQEPGCVANEPPPDVGHGEIGYLILRKNLNPQEAKLEYLKLAVPDILEQNEREQRRKNDEARKISQAAPVEVEEPPREPSPASPPANPPTPPKAPPAPPPQPSDRSPNPWHALWEKLVLTPRDKSKLMQQRGFSEETIKTLGFKSNNQSNRTHLESLRNEFPLDVLIAAGIFKNYRGETRPNPQLVGWGLKRRARKEGDEDQWDWTEPILIPYLNDDGTCFYLRPHKGGVAPARDDDDDDETCSSHVYCPFLLSSSAAVIEGAAVLCEGEFKGAAVYQCGIPVLTIPGITFLRNRAFRAELIALLQRFGITDLVISFDNEVKDDPAFPDRYKPDPWDRYDTQMWAEYIAIDLTREYFGPHKGRVRVGILPDNLRENGKADFDSALSYFVKQTRDVARGTEKARKIFQKLIDDARPHRQSRDLFPSESRRIIECKLQRLFYKALVPAGGETELRLADRYRAIGEIALAKAFRSIVGCYYQREKPERDQRKVLIETATIAHRQVEQARAAGVNGSEIRQLRLKEKAAWEHVRGLPVPVSDFTLTCEFKLHTHDQKAIRLVKIRNRSDSGKSDGALRRLTGAEMARGPEFMRFCYDTGRACWKGGQRLLSHLCEDMDHHSYLRDIFEVNYYGYHAESGMWFFGDCAFGPKGDLIEADKNNIFWNAGIGYQVDSSIDERGTTFEQGAPLMLGPHGAKTKEIDLTDLFHDLCTDMYFTIGGYDAWLMLGLMFAYAAAPELLKLGGHPTPWLFGKMSGGKTTIARWIMRIWGFKDLGGVGIDDRTTPVGMNRFLAQYSCLPVWFDEYRRNNNDAQKEAVLRGAFDRNSGAKGLADHSNRTRSARIFTSPIVTGEGSSSDAATRSRYGHVSVNDRRRIGDGVVRYIKVQADCKNYYRVGRFLMENRPKFVKEMLALHEQWMSNDEIREKILNERVRFVYGTAWSAFITASRAIGGAGGEERNGMEPDFKDFLFVHGQQALQDVISETFLTRFWTDVLSGLTRGKVKRHFFDIRYIQRLEDGHLKEATEGDEGSEKVCYIAPNSVFDEYAQDLRTRGESPPLDLGDLRREMAKEPYWIPPPNGGDRVHRVRINGSRTSCWVISLERNNNDDFLFPSGDDLEQVLEPNQPNGSEDKVNAELQNHSQNGH
jgi:hypothetical protein